MNKNLKKITGVDWKNFNLSTLNDLFLYTQSKKKVYVWLRFFLASLLFLFKGILSFNIFTIKNYIKNIFDFSKKLKNFQNLKKRNYFLYSLIKDSYKKEIEIENFYVGSLTDQYYSKSSLIIKKKVDIIIPWYGDKNIFKLIPQLFKTADKNIAQIIIINDEYPNKNENIFLENFINKINSKKIKYLVNKKNLGFIGTVNRGMELTKNDFLLLNSDTFPIGNWLFFMLKALYSEKKIATVTPFSNNATVFSLPKFNQPNKDDDPNTTALILEKNNFGATLIVPTGHGFCLLVKKEAYRQLGNFDQKTFGRGYGEENDFCCRAIENKYKNVLSLKSYVLHLESQSFCSDEKKKLIYTNLKKLNEKHPYYNKSIETFIKSNKIQSFIFLFNELKKNKKFFSGEYVLTILHNDIFNLSGGVEICTQEIITYLNKYHLKTNQLIYYYNQPGNTYKLLIIKQGILFKIISFNKNNLLKDNLTWIIKNFSIKLTLIEHLINHDVNYINILSKNRIKTIIFIHDFYYLYQIPDLIINNEFVGFDQTNEFWDKVYKKLELKIKSQKKWLDINRNNLLNKKLESIIFNSKFTEEKYCEILKIDKQKNFLISYPNLDGDNL